MTVSRSTENGVAVIRVGAPTLETANVPAFRKALAPMLERDDRLVLDLQEVSFMDSTGLGSLLSCLRAVKERGGTLKLAGLTPDVAALFEMVLMDRVFDIYSDAPLAVESFDRWSDG